MRRPAGSLLIAFLLLSACACDRKPSSSRSLPSVPSASPAAVPGNNAGSAGGIGAQGAASGTPAGAAGGGSVVQGAPQVRNLRFLPGDAEGGGGLAVEAEGYDPDGDPVQFEIEWRKNGEPAGRGNTIEGPVKRGDMVVVTVTPFDGKTRGRPAVVTRQIKNHPPRVEGQEHFQVDGNVVTFQVRASDADGDPLAYSLKEAPAGMTIDRTTGRVRWEAAPGTTGKVPFSVSVTDGFGGEATALFTVSIREEPQPQPR